MTAFAGSRIGFMQGRLSPMVGDKIQAFPAAHWKEEFDAARVHGFPVMEWIFELPDYQKNPLWTAGGRRDIAAVAREAGVEVESVVADYFMERPLFRGTAEERRQSAETLSALIEFCRELEISFLEIPLVDQSSLKNKDEEEALAAALAAALPKARGVTLCLETDLPPARFRALLERPQIKGVKANFDMGNSASLDYDPDQEIAAIGAWIGNVHVKDRRKGGGTVPLGEGDAKFDRVFAALARAGYRGSFILQTARAPGRDVEAACRYRDMVSEWTLGKAAGKRSAQ